MEDSTAIGCPLVDMSKNTQLPHSQIVWTIFFYKLNNSYESWIFCPELIPSNRCTKIKYKKPTIRILGTKYTFRPGFDE